MFVILRKVNKIIAILLLCCFSAILTVETFSHVLDHVEGMELYESDSEESENEIEDAKAPYLVSDQKTKLASIALMIKNHQGIFFLTKTNDHGEINTPPPELDLA